MKWEYTVVYLANFELSDIDALNEFGKMGWEMVTVDNGIIYFKRALGLAEVDIKETVEVGSGKHWRLVKRELND